MDRTEVCCEGVDWIELAQDRVQLRVFWTRKWTIGFLQNKELVDNLSNYQLFKNDTTLNSLYVLHWHRFINLGSVNIFLSPQDAVVGVYKSLKDAYVAPSFAFKIWIPIGKADA